jgi:hypothetical protein
MSHGLLHELSVLLSLFEVKFPLTLCSGKPIRETYDALGKHFSLMTSLTRQQIRKGIAVNKMSHLYETSDELVNVVIDIRMQFFQHIEAGVEAMMFGIFEINLHSLYT